MEVRSLEKGREGPALDLQEEDLHKDVLLLQGWEPEVMPESQFLACPKIFIGMHSKTTLDQLEKFVLRIFSTTLILENRWA